MIAFFYCFLILYISRDIIRNAMSCQLYRINIYIPLSNNELSICLILTLLYLFFEHTYSLCLRGRRGSERMAFGFITTYVISTYQLTLWVRIPFKRGLLDTTLCDKVCLWLATGRWFSPGTLISSTNKTNWHDIAEILLKVVLNSITLTITPSLCLKMSTITQCLSMRQC